MFGLFKKNKTNIAEDESIKDKSKFVVVGFVFMLLTFFGLIFGEVFTSLSLSKQRNTLSQSENIEEVTNNAVIGMAKVGKDIRVAEYEFVKEIMKFMSPSEFQSFKNSISGMANQFNVQINALNEGEPDKLKNKYSIYYIEYQFLSTFENLTFFKNKIAETKYNVNIINESIFRENAKSEKVISEGTIGVYVYEEKDKLLSEKKSIIEKFKAEEQKASSQ